MSSAVAAPPSSHHRSEAARRRWAHSAWTAGLLLEAALLEAVLLA